jgi:hypothetical protein
MDDLHWWEKIFAMKGPLSYAAIEFGNNLVKHEQSMYADPRSCVRMPWVLPDVFFQKWMLYLLTYANATGELKSHKVTDESNMHSGSNSSKLAFFSKYIKPIFSPLKFFQDWLKQSSNDYYSVQKCSQHLLSFWNLLFISPLLPYRVLLFSSTVHAIITVTDSLEDLTWKALEYFWEIFRFYDPHFSIWMRP